MKKYKTITRNGQKKYAEELNPSTADSFAYEEVISEQSSLSNIMNSVWNSIVSIILTFILSISIELLVLLLFFSALSENEVFPSIGFLSGEWLNMLLSFWGSLVLGITLVLIPLLLIIIVNCNRFRKAILAIGCSNIISAILCVTVVILRVPIIQSLTGEWQDILINTTAVFRDYGMICAIVLIVIGVLFLSIYASIAILKGGKYERLS